MMEETQLALAIGKKLMEIRKLLEENGGVQYLAMFILENGEIHINNLYCKTAKENKGYYLNYYFE